MLLIDLSCQILDCYVFWTIFSALPALFWFYPLNELALTGYETFVLVLFSPILLQLKFMQTFLSKYSIKLCMQILISLSLLSFQASSTFWRLSILAIGSAVCMLKLSIDLIKNDRSIIECYACAFLLFLVSRIPYKSISPAFNDHQSNIFLFTVAVGGIISKGTFEKSKNSNLWLFCKIFSIFLTNNSRISSNPDIQSELSIFHDIYRFGIFRVNHLYFGCTFWRTFRHFAMAANGKFQSLDSRAFCPIFPTFLSGFGFHVGL